MAKQNKLEDHPTVVHRDSVLTDRQRTAGNTMMTCVSRAGGDRLVLDL